MIRRFDSDLPLNAPAIYNPDLLSREELAGIYIARQPLLAAALDRIRNHDPVVAAAPRLYVGVRGMGKTTLLRRLALAVEEDGLLAEGWIPLTFPEEQYNIADLADFWLNCLDALADALVRRGREEAATRIDAFLEQWDETPSTWEAAADYLLKSATRLGLGLILLLDNLDLILARLKGDHDTLRRFFSDQPQLLLIGAAVQEMAPITGKGKALHGFFARERLDPLSLAETRAVLLTLAGQNGQEGVRSKIDGDPGRLKALHTLTGGNPRTVALLYGVLAQPGQGGVRQDLEQLFDRYTPLYKARFESLAIQSQQVVDALALQWDPASARQIADRTGFDINVVSSQLNRLVREGEIEKVPLPPGRRWGFQIAERFFNIWYLMRASRRVRRKLTGLVEFLKLFYSRDELHERAVAHIAAGQTPGDPLRHAEYGFALARVGLEAPLSGALAHYGLRLMSRDPLLRGELAPMLDLGGEDRDLEPLDTRMRRLAAAEQLCLAPGLPWPDGWSGARFWEFLGGNPWRTPEQKEQEAGMLAAPALAALVAEYKGRWLEDIRWFGSATLVNRLYSACREGYLANLFDLDGAETAAASLGDRELPLLVRAVQLQNDRSDVAKVEALARDLEQTPLAFAWWKVGVVHMASSRLEAAEAALRRAMSLETKFSWPRAHLAILLAITNKNLEEAESLARAALVLAPQEREFDCHLAVVLITRKRWPEAAKAVQQFITAGGPDNDWGFFVALCRHAARAGYAAEAVALLDGIDGGDRFRPLREALAAVAEGSADYLLRIAPEVREPARELYALLVPPSE